MKNTVFRDGQNRRGTMLENYVTLRQYESKKKNVILTRYEGRSCILKLCKDAQAATKEATMMQKIANTGYAPQVYTCKDNVFICEYIEGESLQEKFVMATMQDDTKMMSTLAKSLCIFLQMFHSVSGGFILEKIDFANFIITDDNRCIGISFDGIEENLPYHDVAHVIVTAIVECVGDYTACFPFISKVMSCFHLDTIDIINDVAIAMDENKHFVYDKQEVLSTLVSFAEKTATWKLLGEK
ncbi:MAG: hypothetical protein RR416_02385 [Clostridia bacterium]